MITQSIFQVGNSHAVAIPSHLMKELNLKKGQKVTVDKTPDDTAVIIRPISKKANAKIHTSGLTPEFKAWLDDVTQKEKQVIKDLAHT
jgi:antitoxin component of MazEF toxin-antitoxin module